MSPWPIEGDQQPKALAMRGIAASVSDPSSRMEAADKPSWYLREECFHADKTVT
jgi:hypothetical protein